MKKLAKILGAVVGVIVVLVLGFVLYVQLTYAHDYGTVPLPTITASQDPAVIARGAYVTHAVAHCSACHGSGESVTKKELPADLDDLRGGYVLKAGPFGTFYPANLTPDDTGIAKLSDPQIARAVRHGVSADGQYAPLMAMAVGPMADEDLVAVISYLRSIKPQKNAIPKDEWGLLAKALSSKFTPRMTSAPPFVKEGAASKERGEYLALGPALCGGCHSPRDPMNGFALTGVVLSGANKPDTDSSDRTYEVIAPNLTPDPETGVLSGYNTPSEFIDRFRKVGRTTKGSPMPWENFKRMTDADLESLFLYLKSIPPVKHKTGPSRRIKGSFKG